MAFSYSFHMSAKSHALTTTGKVAQVSRHNLREYESADYDRNKIEIVSGSDKSILDNVKKIYHDEFDRALEQYNAGKRSDRQITDYLDHVSKSRSDVAAEIIIQIGDQNFWRDKSDSERRQMSYIYRDQLRALEKLVPEFKVASAVIHYDESSPHMHVVGVPVASGYKKGLERQVAKTKVFDANRLSFLQDRMRDNAIRGMELEQNKNLFADMQLKTKEKGRNKDIPKKELDKYYFLTEQIDVISRDLKRAHVEQQDAALAVINSKKELQNIQTQRQEAARNIIQYNDANNKLIERNNELSADNDALLQKNASMGQIIAQNEQKIAEQGAQIAKIDAVSSYLHQGDRDIIKMSNYTIPGKKSFWGQNTESREGVFVEGLTKEELHAVIDRANVNDSLSDHADRMLQEAERNARDIENNAQMQAQAMLDQAQQQINEAQRIILERDSIIQKAKEQAKKIKEQFAELAKKIQNMLASKDDLRKEIEQMESCRANLEPLKETVDNLTKAKKILSGELDHEFTKAAFKPWDEMPFGKDWRPYQQEGKLLAIYDGAVVKVGLNDEGGWDDQIRRDEEDGLCTVGIMLDEKRIRVPEKLLKELIRSIDRSKPISRNLQAFIKQQQELNRVKSKYFDLER